MAAITYAIQKYRRAGDTIVSSASLYGGTHTLFANTLEVFGIHTPFLWTHRIPGILRPPLEHYQGGILRIPGQPHSDPIDLEAVAEISHRHGCPSLDNTFATPHLLRPLEHGAGRGGPFRHQIYRWAWLRHRRRHRGWGTFDWAKGGKFPRPVGTQSLYHGLVFTEACGNQAYITKIRATLLRDTGAALSPFHAFLLLQGLETLSCG